VWLHHSFILNARFDVNMFNMLRWLIATDCSLKATVIVFVLSRVTKCLDEHDVPCMVSKLAGLFRQFDKSERCSTIGAEIAASRRPGSGEQQFAINKFTLERFMESCASRALPQCRE
jgi:hypothetical protein